MEQLAGRIAVVTGGGTGMGRELVRHLAMAGCHVATCDVSADAMAETKAAALRDGVVGTRVTTFVADVADEASLGAFRDAVVAEHETDCVHLLFNNAGIAGGGSFIADERAVWERTFAVDWGGVYLSLRTFLPLVIAADEGHVVNTSSVNGLWASIGPRMPHTAYSAAKFAVRGLTEALICDLRVHAPHVRASVVMPGHVGTSIVLNTTAEFSRDEESSAARLMRTRAMLDAMGTPVDSVSDEDLEKGMQLMGEQFRDAAPLSASDAAAIILDGVRANRWRILVGEDAEFLDDAVRRDPEHVYEPEFFEMLRASGHFGGFG